MRRHCQTIAALLLTLLPRCAVVEVGYAPAYGRTEREGANTGAGARGSSAWLENAPESPPQQAPAKKKRGKQAPRKVPGKLQPPVGPGGC